MLGFPKSNSTSFLVPAGTHQAVCYCIADLGTQETSFGKKPMLHIGWEIPDERMSNGRVAVVSRRYAMSADPKSALRIDVEGWLGKKLTDVDLDSFNFADLIGQCCLVSVQHSDGSNGRIYANVKSVLPPPRGMAKKQNCENDPVVFDLGEFDRSQYAALPGWLQTTIARSPEYAEVTGTIGITAREALQRHGFRGETEAPRELPSPAKDRELPSDEIPW